MFLRPPGVHNLEPMGKFKIKRPEKGYSMTSVNLTQDDRRILAELMKAKQLKMGEALRYALREVATRGEGTNGR